MSATSPGKVDNIFHICICINVDLVLELCFKKCTLFHQHSKMQ